MSRFRCVALLPFTLSACAGGAPPRREPTPQGGSAPAPALTALTANDAPWVLRLTASSDRLGPQTVCSRENGGRVVLGAVGSYRVRVDANIRFADDVSLAPIVACAPRSDGGWLFATADGALLAASSFLGAMERVADTGGEGLAAGFASAGVLVARGDSGQLLLGRAAGGFAPAIAPGGAALQSVAFADEHTGLGVSAPGLLWLSRDGGATFAGVASGGIGVLDVTHADSGLQVETTSRAPTVPDLTGVAQIVAPGDDSVVERGFQDLGGFRIDLLANGPGRRTTALAWSRAVLDDGTALFVLPGASLDAAQRLFWVSPDGSTAERELFAGARCEARAWNHRAALVCTADAALTRVYVGQPPFAAPWERVDLDPSARGRGMGFAPDSPLIILAGACARDRGDGGALGEEAQDESRRRREFCWFDGAAWHTERIAYPGSLMMLRGFHGLAGRVGPSETMDPSGEPAVAVLDFTPQGVSVRGLDTGPGLVTTVALVDGGARVAGVAATEHEVWGFAGPAAGAMARFALPAGARQAAFATAERGLAAGANAAQLWGTDDGGQTWTPIAAPVRGAAENRSFLFQCSGPSEAAYLCEMGNLAMPVVDCHERFCTVNDEAVWGTPALLGAPGPGALASAHAVVRPAMPAGTAPQPTGLGVAALLGEVRCSESDVPPSPESSDDTPRGVALAQLMSGAPAPRRAQTGRVVTVDGTLDWTTTPAGELDRYALRWSVSQGRRRVTVRAREVELAPVGDTGYRGPVFTVAALTRDVAVIERCVPGSEMFERPCDLVIAPSGGLPVRMSETAAFANLPTELRRNGSPRLVAVMPLASGRWALQFRQTGEALNTYGDVYWNIGRIDDVVVIDSIGAVVARRAFVWPAHGIGGRFLARRGDEPGLLALPFTDTGATRAVFYTLDSRDAGSAVEAPFEGRVLPCASAAGASTAVVAVASTSAYGAPPRAGEGWLLGGERDESQPMVRTQLEVHADGVCFREVRAAEPIETLEGRDSPREVRYVAHGAVSDVDLATEHGSRRLRCAYQPLR